MIQPADLAFFVPGRPQPEGSLKAFCPRPGARPIVIHDNKVELRNWRHAVAAVAYKALSQKQGLPNTPWTGPVFVAARFVFHIPKSRRRKANKTPTLPQGVLLIACPFELLDIDWLIEAGKIIFDQAPSQARTVRPDTDKCMRAILDALTGAVYIDDSQVAAQMEFKLET